MDGSRYVGSTGPFDSDAVLVGEAPGENEVEEGEPFVGRAGSRLDEALREIGVSRRELYITNLVKVRPPDNRDPREGEIEAWRPLLQKEVDEVDPDSIVALGSFASRELTGSRGRITDIHGRRFSSRGYDVCPVFHPAATLYDRSKWTDFVDDLRRALEGSGSGQKSLKEI